MKLLLRFLLTLSLVFFGSAQRGDAHLYADSGMRIAASDQADHTRVVHIAERPAAEWHSMHKGYPKAQDELAASDNQNEDDREDEEHQLTAKQMPPPHFFQSFLNDVSGLFLADISCFHRGQALDARCAAAPLITLFQVFLI